jgi:hypothetical protein
MKKFTKCVGVVATALVLTLVARAEDTPKNVTGSSDQLVAATAELQHAFDTKTAKQGDAVTAKLSGTVHLSGTTLPRNTVLLGHVDEVQPSQNKGIAKVVLTFDHARLENGQQVAIKSTIIGIFPAGTEQSAPSLSPDMKIDQEPSGAHGYGLTSSVVASNSGTLSADGKNIHLANGTEFQFAITPAGESASSSTGN